MGHGPGFVYTQWNCTITVLSVYTTLDEKKDLTVQTNIA